MTKLKLAIDFGSDYLRIWENGTGLVFCEPALVAVEKKGKKYVLRATGQVAENLKNEFEENTLVFGPIFEGVVQSAEYAAAILERALEGLYSPSWLEKAVAIVAVPSGLGEKDKKEYLKTAKMAGLQNVSAKDDALMARHGQYGEEELYDVLVVDAGAGKCDFQIICGDEVKKSATLGLGGNSIQHAIAKVFWENDGLYISDEACAFIQQNLCSLLEGENRAARVEAIYKFNGEKVTKTITSTDVYPVARAFFDEVLLVTKTLLKEYYSETGEEINNVLFTGGLAKTRGLEAFFATRLEDVRVFVDREPGEAVIRGLAVALK